MRAIWIPHSDIPLSQRVEVTAVPDGHDHELLDVLVDVGAGSDDLVLCILSDIRIT